jgi:hypothetical protein
MLKKKYEKDGREFSKEQIRALADFWPVFANPKFVYEVQDEVKEKELAKYR